MVRASPLLASGFPAAAKSQNPFLADLNRVWLTCFHISQEEGEREGTDLSFLSNKELWKTPICCVLTKTSCVWNRLPIISSLPAHARRAGAAEQRAFQPTHWPYITRRVAKPTCSFGGDPALPTSAAGLAGPVGRRLLICTSESVRLHTRDLRDNEGFVLHLRFRDCTKTMQTERKILLFFFSLMDQNVFLSLTVTLFQGYETGVRFHELDN